MSHMVTIILQFDVEAADSFEKLFAAEVMPLWNEFAAQGKFAGATLARVFDGDNLSPDIQQYVLHVRLNLEEANEEFDTDARFLAFLKRMRPLQPAEPLVRIGELIFEI